MRTKMFMAVSMLAAPTALSAQSVPAEPVQPAETPRNAPAEAPTTGQMGAPGSADAVTNTSASDDAQAPVADNIDEHADHGKIKKNPDQPR